MLDHRPTGSEREEDASSGRGSPPGIMATKTQAPFSIQFGCPPSGQLVSVRFLSLPLAGPGTNSSRSLRVPEHFIFRGNFRWGRRLGLAKLFRRAIVVHMSEASPLACNLLQ